MHRRRSVALAVTVALGAVCGGTSDSAAAAPEPRWLVGDLHVHVSPPDVPGHSTFTVASAIEFARTRALDFVVLTPHESDSSFPSPKGGDAPPVSGQELIEAAVASASAATDARPVLAVAGWEFTRESPGHLGLSFFRMRDLAGTPPAKKAAAAIARRALVVVNHPFFRPVASDLPVMKLASGDRGWRPFLGEAQDDHQWNGIEVWHAPSVTVQKMHATRAAKFPETQMAADALRAWDRETTATRRRIVAVGGSDCHGALPYATSPMALCSVRVDAFDEESLHRGLLAARVTFGKNGGAAARDLKATSDVEGERASIGDSLRATSEVRLTWSGKAVLVEDGVRVGEFEGGAVRRVEPKGAFRSWRIEKADDAFSNCIYANLP